MGLWSKKNKETADENSKTEPVEEEMSKKNEMKSEQEKQTAAKAEQNSKEEAAECQDLPQEEAADKEQQPQEEAKAEVPQKDDTAEQLAAMTDRYTRLLADFDNFRKRMVREREEQTKRANERLLSDLLPVLDNLAIALSKAPNPEDPVVTGMQMVNDEFLKILDKYGMKPIDAKGKPFDPSIHEALTQMPSPTVPAQTVIEQFKRGWILGGKLLRPAQVIVSSGAPEAPAQPAEQSAGEEEQAAGKEDK